MDIVKVFDVAFSFDGFGRGKQIGDFHELRMFFIFRIFYLKCLILKKKTYPVKSS